LASRLGKLCKQRRLEAHPGAHQVLAEIDLLLDEWSDGQKDGAGDEQLAHAASSGEPEGEAAVAEAGLLAQQQDTSTGAAAAAAAAARQAEAEAAASAEKARFAGSAKAPAAKACEAEFEDIKAAEDWLGGVQEYQAAARRLGTTSRDLRQRPPRPQ
jgi:hypothetical protein